MSYTLTQKSNCILWLAQNPNISTIQEKFKEKFGSTHRLPLASEIQQWYDDFKRTGLLGHENFVSKPSMVDVRVADFEKETGLLNLFGFKKIHKCHPYRMHLKEELKKENVERRKEFVKKELDRIHASPHLPHRLWFGGEATFYTNGRVECHDFVYCSEDPTNPEFTAPLPPTSNCVTVFAALNHDGIIGPYISYNQADVDTYKLHLKKFLYELRQIQRLQMQMVERMPYVQSYPTFVHDNSKLHEGLKDFLNEEFSSQCWIGPGSKHGEFPRLSPDLNPLCFFLWGHVKKIVYERDIGANDVSELAYRIHHAFTEIIPEMLQATIHTYKERLKLVLEAGGNLVGVHDDEENKNDMKNLLDYQHVPMGLF